MFKKLLLASLVAAVLLSGCVGFEIVETDTQLTLMPDENWDLKVEMVYPAEEGLAEAEAQVEYLEQNQQVLNEEYSVQAKGDVSEVDKDGNVTLSLHYWGQGFDWVNEVLWGAGSIETQEIREEKTITIQISQGFEQFVTTRGSTVTIKGGKILSTNGERLNATTVRWFNPGSIEVTMEEPGAGISGWGIALIALGVLSIAAAIGWRLGWFKRKSHPLPAPVSQASSFCSNCGAALTPQARFCNKCGSPNVQSN